MRSNLNLFALAIYSITVFSCGNGKDAVPTASTDVVIEEVEIIEDVVEELPAFVDATVVDKSGNEGCGFIIQKQNSDGSMQFLEPLSLDDTFKVDGLKVEVRYTLSRRQSICTLSSIPITIDEIKLK